MNRPWNESDLAKLSADLNEELDAIFEQVEAALSPEADPLSEAPFRASSEEALFEEADQKAFSLPAIAPADLMVEESLEDLDIDVARVNDSSLPGPADSEPDWLPPGLLGEPERPPVLSPEVMGELRRMIEEAVEKGLAAALAKFKG